MQMTPASNVTATKSKLLVLTTSFPINENSSSGIFVLELVNALSSKYNVTVITPSGDSAQVSQSFPFKLVPFRYAAMKHQILAQRPGGIPAKIKSNPLYVFLTIPFLISFLSSTFRRAKKSDIIFANWSISGVVGGIAGILFNKPVVTTLRGEDVNRASTSFVHKLLLRLCIHLSDHIVTVSTAIYESIHPLCTKLRTGLSVIPNGVSESFYEISEKTPSDSINIVAVGSLIPRKSFSTLIESLPLVRTDTKLYLIGDGPELDNLQELTIKNGTQDRVVFCGQLPHKKLPEYLELADVVVSTSISEGRPNSILEAMAAGKAIVATDIDGHRELFLGSMRRHLFPTRNSLELAKRIDDFSTPESRLRAGKASRDFMLNNKLTWINSAKRYSCIFDKLISRQ